MRRVTGSGEGSSPWDARKLGRSGFTHGKWGYFPLCKGWRGPQRAYGNGQRAAGKTHHRRSPWTPSRSAARRRNEHCRVALMWRGELAQSQASASWEVADGLIR